MCVHARASDVCASDECVLQFGTEMIQMIQRSANHLSQFGTAERESFESVRDRGARII